MGIFMGMIYKIILNNTIPTGIVNLISEIDEFKGRWEALKIIAPDRLSFLRKIATIASIGSSTRIEGAKLSDSQVEELLSHIGKHSFRSRDEEEVLGYAEAMNVVFDSYPEIPITENYIKQLHRILLRYSSKDQRHIGDYKKLPNNVDAYDEEGKHIGTVLETATPFQTPHYMKELVEWYNIQIKKREFHPLLIIGAFIVHFLAIHPFQDGNGRLSRILTTLVLLKGGYQYVPFCSLESIIEENKERYYLALRRTQNSFKTDHAGMNEWISFFLQTLKKQKDILQQRIEREKILLNSTITKIEQDILTLVNERGRITNADVVILTNANRNTIKKHLKELVEKGIIKQHGIGKGTFYTKA